jgi:hypothetical protein
LQHLTQKERTLKKSVKRLALNRDTVRNLSGPDLQEAAAAGISVAPSVLCPTLSCRFSCLGTCNVTACLPSCGNCTVIC